MGWTAVRIKVPVGAPLRSAETDISDLTSSVRVGTPSWVDESTLEIPLDPEPSEAEQAKIRRRLLTRDSTQENRVASMQEIRAALAADKSPIAAAVRLLLADRLGPLA